MARPGVGSEGRPVAVSPREGQKTGIDFLRCSIVSICMMLLAAPALAQSTIVSSSGAGGDFKLGGSARFEARVPTIMPETVPEPRETYRFPLTPPWSITEGTRRSTPIGDVSIFQTLDDDDVMSLGTALTRGKTTTGIRLGYDEGSADTRSELFVDFALNDTFSVGLSGIITEDGASQSDPVTRLGVSAAVAFDGGSFVQGGIADGRDESPVFGLSLGFQF